MFILLKLRRHALQNYLLYGRKLDVKLLPFEQAHLKLFKNGNSRIVAQNRINLKRAKEQQNNRVVMDAKGNEKVIVTQRQVKRRGNKKADQQKLL